jgi:hypothetical protein
MSGQSHSLSWGPGILILKPEKNSVKLFFQSVKFFFFSFYLTAWRQNTITIMLIALIFQKESIFITGQLWLISPISTVRKIQNFSGHRGHRKSPLLLSFLYLHLSDISRVTWETPSSEAIPSVRSHLGVRASYATQSKQV